LCLDSNLNPYNCSKLPPLVHHSIDNYAAAQAVFDSNATASNWRQAGYTGMQWGDQSAVVEGPPWRQDPWAPVSLPQALVAQVQRSLQVAWAALGNALSTSRYHNRWANRLTSPSWGAGTDSTSGAWLVPEQQQEAAGDAGAALCLHELTALMGQGWGAGGMLGDVSSSSCGSDPDQPVWLPDFQEKGAGQSLSVWDSC
jgi:hypothetical protein